MDRWVKIGVAMEKIGVAFQVYFLSEAKVIIKFKLYQLGSF